MLTYRQRLTLAWSILWTGYVPSAPQPAAELPASPVTPSDSLTTLLATPLSLAMADAVAKTERDAHLATAAHAVKFADTLQWCVHYARDRYHVQLPASHTWLLAFLLEYHVGRYKGRV